VSVDFTAKTQSAAKRRVVGAVREPALLKSSSFANLCVALCLCGEGGVDQPFRTCGSGGRNSLNFFSKSESFA
jgi:hypothetical protein